MSKHYFRETSTSVEGGKYHRVLYCEWCGVVVWNFNRTDESVKTIQKKAGTVCEATVPILDHASSLVIKPPVPMNTHDQTNRR